MASAWNLVENLSTYECGHRMRKSLIYVYFVASLNCLWIPRYCSEKQAIDQSIYMKHMHFVLKLLAVLHA